MSKPKMSLTDMLLKAMERSEVEKDEMIREANRKLPSKTEQFLKIQDVAKVPTFHVGQIVTRSLRGVTKIKFPDAEKGQIAVITEVYCGVILDERGDRVHGEIGVFNKSEDEEGVYFYTIDFRDLKAV